MKKVILASVAVAATVLSTSAQAAADTTFCTAGTAGPSTVSASTGTDKFVKVAFSPKCSANTHVVAEDSNTYYRVGAASAKGKFPVYGSTSGGGVLASTTSCAATGCVVGDANAALLLGATG